MSDTVAKLLAMCIEVRDTNDFDGLVVVHDFILEHLDEIRERLKLISVMYRKAPYRVEFVHKWDHTAALAHFNNRLVIASHKATQTPCADLANLIWWINRVGVHK